MKLKKVLNVNNKRLYCFIKFSFSKFIVDNPEKKPKCIVDVGCGIGGSSRYLAKKYGAECHGITLSPVQAERAQALAVDQGLADKVHLDLSLYITQFSYEFEIRSSLLRN